MRMDALSDQFSFQAAQVDAVPYPFKGGEKCEIRIENTLILTGYLELVKIEGDSESHTISISGRDITSDLVDSSITQLGEIVKGETITLVQVIEAVLNHIKLSEYIKVEPTSIEIEDFKKGDDLLSPKPGVNAFKFLHKLARTRQVFLTSTPEGKIRIVRGDKTARSGGSIRHRVVDNSEDVNNLLSYNMSYDESNLFYSYKNVAQSSANSWLVSKIEVNVKKLVNNTAGPVDSKAEPVIDEDMKHRSGRQMVSVMGASKSANTSFNEAKWEANIRRARARSFNCKVDGFYTGQGSLWSTNTLAKVTSDYAGIDADMLVSGLSFIFDSNLGTTTDLMFVEKDAYSLELDKRDLSLRKVALSFEPNEAARALRLKKLQDRIDNPGGGR